MIIDGTDVGNYAQDPHRYTGSGGFGGNSGVSRGPACEAGYHKDASGACVADRATQAQDLGLQALRNVVSGGGGSAPSPVAAAPAVSPMSAYNNSNSSTTTTTTTSSAPRSHVARPDFQPGSDANLLRAKDRQGQIARSALTGLRSALGERQVLGSGAEGAGTENIAAAGLQSLTDVNREQMIQDDQARQTYDLAGYQGDISQRGQDIGESDALAALQAQMRGQDISAATAARGQDITARGQDLSAQSAARMSQQNAILDALRAAQYLY